MTTITLDKTWEVDEFSFNHTTVVDNNKNILFGIKRMMKDHGWSHFASSDSSSVSTDPGTDLWVSIANIICATGAHSWIVLKNTSISANFQVCFDMSNVSAYNMTCVVSYNSGFTSGTPTARPTAADELVVLSNTAWAVNSVDNRAVTMYYSTDFKCYRMFYSYVTNPEGVMVFDVPKDPVSWWDEPFIAKIGSTPITYANTCSTTSTQFKTRINGVATTLAFGSWGFSSSSYGTATNYGTSPDYNGAHTLSPIPIISITVTRPGIIGLLYDMWWVSSVLPVGTYIPTSIGDRGLFVLGNIAQANDGNKRMR